MMPYGLPDTPEDQPEVEIMLRLQVSITYLG